MLGPELVALDPLAARLGVAGVEVEPMRAGDQRQGLVEVGPQLVGVRALPRIVAGDARPPPIGLAGALEAADVVALPAMERNSDGAKCLDRPVNAHTDLGILIACQLISLFDTRGSSHPATPVSGTILQYFVVRFSPATAAPFRLWHGPPRVRQCALV